MRFLKSASFVCLVFFSSITAKAADEKTDVDRIISVGRSDSRVMEHLDYLCNRFGPRLTGSDFLQNASEWTVDTFKSFGIENARLEQWGEFPVGFNRGPWFGLMIQPSEKPLHFGTFAWTAGTKGVTRGRVVLVPKSEEELEKVRPLLNGAWVFTRRTEANARPSAELQKAFDEAVKQAKIAGNVRPSAGQLIHTGGGPTKSWDNLPTIPEINLLKKEYDEIAELAAKGEEVILEFDVRNYFKKGPVRLYNVVADLPGTEWPDEYVIIGGHIDSWDGATGAMDNGTGTAAVIEAARILMQAGVKPRRTIRFMLWSGEEQGLLGSRGYIKKNPELMSKISAVLVNDGGTNYLSGLAATEAMLSDFEQALAPIKTLDPAMPFNIQKVTGLPRGIGSDHDSFLDAGVPGFYFSQRGGRANYNRIHHTHFDTYEGAIPEYQVHSSIVMALAAHGIANLDHLLSRDKLLAPRNSIAFGNRRMIGVQMDELKIEEVLEGTVAVKAGLKVGDEFLKLDGKKLENREQLIREIQRGDPKRTVTIQRDGKEIEIVLEWPAPQSKN